MSEERYEIRGKIGQGGVGAVYRAYDQNLNREVAIKRVLTEEGFDANDNEDGATKALLKEAIALCSVQHPNIVTVYDAGVDDDGPYVVMELLSGRTLDEMVERGTMVWPDFRETAVQCLEALIAAQELDLVHRDIKPSNVMVTWLPSGKFQVKLVDFGLAKFSSAPSLQTIDHGDAVFGSIHFMAPEQFERIPLDQRTDMYSLGCVFFFCLTGHFPFDAETAPMVMAAHLQNEFTPLKHYRSDLPDWLCQWVEWHIARSPDERPRDARESLERFLSFEQPVEQTAPVAVQAVDASSIQGQAKSLPDGSSAHLTGPVPIHAQVPQVQEQSAPEVAAQPAVPAAPAPSKLITGPLVPAAVDEAAAPSSPADPASAESPPQVTVVKPKPILPPEGAKPSIHTGAQVVNASTGPVLQQAAPHETPAAPVAPAEAAVPAAPKLVTPATPKLATPAAPKLATGKLEKTAAPAKPTQLKAAQPVAPAPAPASTAPAPASAPTPAQDAAPPVTPIKSSKSTVKIVLAAVLGVGVIITSLLLVDVMGTRKDEEELQKLMQQATDPTVTEIPMSSENVEGFLAAAAALDFDKEKGAVYQTLYLSSSTDGFDIDQRVAEFATTEKLNEQVRSKLLQVVGKRGGESAMPFLMKFVKNSKDEGSVVAALDATGKNVAGRHLIDLYKLISSAQSVEVRSAAERAVRRHLDSQTNNSFVAKELLKSFRGSLESAPRESFLRLLGATGASEAEVAIEEALSSDESTLKVAGYTALSNWRDDSLFERHFEGLKNEETQFLRGHAFDSLIKFLSGRAEFDEKSEQKMWTLMSKELQDEREKSEFIRTLARGTEGWAMALIEPLTKDSNEKTSFLAERALESMKNREEK